MKLKVEIWPTSMTGFSILIMRKPTDTKYMPAVQQTLPTDVAEYIKRLIEQDQRSQAQEE